MHALMPRPTQPCYLSCSRPKICFARRLLKPLNSQANYYEVLRLDTEATAADVKEAYRALAKQLHPDVNKAPNAQEAFMLVKRAYHVLSQAELRAEHDSSLGLASARAKDPRFARFERWRREVIPDLREQLAVWTQEINLMLSEAESKLQQIQATAKAFNDAKQVVLTQPPSPEELGTASSTASSTTSEHQAAVQAELLAAVAELRAKVQRQYDKRYEQVQVIRLWGQTPVSFTRISCCFSRGPCSIPSPRQEFYALEKVSWAVQTSHIVDVWYN
jgi:hypothetical protein